MDKLERFIMPMILIVGIIAILLAKADPDHVVVLARIVGIFLGTVLSLAFIFRLMGMFLRYREAKRIIGEMEAEIDRLRALTAAEEQESPEQPS